MNEKELNELRCFANEVICKLHKEKQVGQLQILKMACDLSIKDIDADAYRRAVIEAYEQLNPPHKP